MEVVAMEIVHERCAGLDVHKKSVVACVITPGHKEVRTFGTMTRDLMGMADWLTSMGVTHVAMESTGVYWRAIFNLLEGYDFDLLVANPRYMARCARPQDRRQRCGVDS